MSLPSITHLRIRRSHALRHRQHIYRLLASKLLETEKFILSDQKRIFFKNTETTKQTQPEYLILVSDIMWIPYLSLHILVIKSNIISLER